MAVAESIGIAALGWVASTLVKMLLDEGFSSLGINAEKKLEEMEKTVLPVLESVIEKAEGSPHRRMVEGWLQRLKDAYDDVEDALDVLNYDRLKRKAANRVRSSLHIPKPVKLKGGLDMLSPYKIKLKRSLNKLEKIAGEAEKLLTLLGAQPYQTAAAAPDGSRETTSLPLPEVFGRDKDREEIIRHLKTEPAAGVPIIAVVGRPGVGKTTLTQYVCDQLGGELGDGRFDLVMWVHASRNFSASEIMKDIIQQASIASEPQDLDAMVAGWLNSPEALRLKMNEKLSAQKFLLMIDDVLCDREDHKKNWDTLFRCLGKCCCLLGSKILVTSQTKDAPRKIAAAYGAAVEHIHHLGDLAENDFADLFIHYALPNGEIDSDLREDLKEKCKTIAAKLNKDPTAAKMVGETIATELACLLHSRGNLHAYLETIADKDWSGDRTKALMWSYQHLPAHLQRCFSYCSLYPKGYEFKALELVQLWMAQGFIKPDDQNKRMENAGNGYLNDLVSRFYIQSHDRFHRSSGTDKLVCYYTLHELLYDLAEKVHVAGGESIPANKMNENNKEEICKLKKLRTLIFIGGESIKSKADVVIDISSSLKQVSFKKLRVLVLELNLEILPKFISEMKHLRILQVSSTGEFMLPESVCTLYQLQVLRIKNASSLPKRLNNLVSLRYLEANSDLISAIPDIGKLTSLQGLENFQVRKEKGYELEQLKNLNELRGRLCIDNLENVESEDSAIAANLKKKEHLDMLQLVWRDGKDNVNSDLDVEILEGLQFPPYLTGLSLDGYRGRSCPSWPKCCRSLELSHLSRLEALHALPPQLTELKIVNTPSLIFVTKEDLRMSPADKRSIIEIMRKRMPEWFPHQYQESLVDDENEIMNFIAATNGSNSEASSAEHNKSAPAADVDVTAVWGRWLETHKRKMESIYSRENKAKLQPPSTLTKLSLEGCNITDRALSACLQTLTSLIYLSLAEIRAVTCLPAADVLGNLTSLHDVTLRGCWAITSLGGTGSLPDLRNLLLIGCPCLDGETALLPSSLRSILFESCADVDVILANANLPHLSKLVINQCHMRTASLQFGNLRSLRSLSIRHCPGLLSSVDVQELHSLKFLILHNCSNLEALMNLPSSLKSLAIHGCPILEKQSVDIDEFSSVTQKFRNMGMSDFKGVILKH